MIPIHTKIHANTCMLGEKQCAEPKFNTCHYIPNTCQYIQIHNTIHASYIPIQDRSSTRVFAQHTSIGMYPGMYWYVLCIHTNTHTCLPIQVSTAKYIPIQTHTDKYLPIRIIHLIINQYLQIQTSTYHTYQYIPIHPIQVNID